MKKVLSYLLILTLTFTMLFSGVSFSYAAETQQQESDPAAGEAYVEDEVLVVFEDEVSEKKAEAIVEDADVQTENVEEIVAPEASSAPEETPYLVTLNDKETSVEDAVDELEKDRDVAYVQPNYLYTTEEEEISTAKANKAKLASDTFRSKQWNLDYINAEEAWEYIDQRKDAGEEHMSEKAIKIATLDSGISRNHEDLNANIDWAHCITVAGKSSPDYPPYNNSNLKDGHGTGVAGVIAATSNNGKGIAGAAAGTTNDLIQLMGINVFQNYKGGQSAATTDDIIKGIEYACEKEAKVINMALGHSYGENDGNGNPHNDKLLQAKIKEAVSTYDVTFVATAGNTKDQSGWYPSDFDYVISVINTVEYEDAWSKECKASGSSYGSKKDISAPGSNIWRTVLSSEDDDSEPKDDFYDPGYGTSLAAPHVAAVAAMVLYVNPTLTTQQVYDILCGTTTDLYTDGFDIYTGYGNVDAYAAVKAAGEYTDTGDKAAIPDPDRNRHSELLAEPAELDTPTGLKAVNSGMEDITLTWNKVPDATQYWVLRSESGKSGTYEKIASVPQRSSSPLKYVDSSADYPKTYYYIIRPLSTSQETHKKIHGEDSKPASAKSAIADKLTTPTVSAKGTNYKSVKISWNKISGASNYRVWRATSQSGDYKLLKQVEGKNTKSYTDSTCTLGKQYWYKVYARGTASNGKFIRSTGSKPVSSKAVLPAPSVSITSVDYRTNKVSWKKVSGASGYRIYRGNSRNGKYSKVKTITNSKTTSWQNTGLKAGKAYYYKVRAYRTVSSKRYYGTVSASNKHIAKPKKPTFSIKKKGRQVTLTLKKNSKLTGYVIYRKNGNGKWKKVKTVTVNGRRGATYARNLSRGKTYSFKVRAYKRVSEKRVYSLYSSIKKRKI